MPSSTPTGASEWRTSSIARSTTRRTSTCRSAPASRRRTSTPSPSRTSPSCPGTPSSSGSGRRSCAGTRSRSSSRRTPSRPSWAATSRATSRAETLYEVGFNHFWRGRSDEHLGDLVYLQGHSSPGFYARAFLEGRLTEAELRRFRQEVGGGGLSSYPHPWLMPRFWQFPTVSMGLGPLMAIYQARFMKYLDAREIVGARRPQGVGVHGRRRDGRARVDGRDRPRRDASGSTT